MSDETETADAPSISKPPGNNESNGSFRPSDQTLSQPSFSVPNEQWITILETLCTFPPEIFADVMLNLIKNPNLTSSHLFRADIFYDSDKDPTAGLDDEGSVTDGMLAKQLKAEYRPVKATLPGYELQRTIVRQMIPRNPQLDKPLVQTCHFFHRKSHGVADENLIMYIPHVSHADEIPFYHPCVQRLVFQHTWSTEGTTTTSISFQLFPSQTLTTKLSRTALRLLQTVHKHGQGRLAGYQKRVQLDQILPQKRYQDTYARLKAVYGRQIASQWVEVTDPGKHVFEDIGIAAFLIELWRDMYASSPSDSTSETKDSASKTAFPGFVDIGCGNGVLTYILLSEGYSGWGFDARERKTWKIFPSAIQANLKSCLLVPEIFQSPPQESAWTQPSWHNGLFAPGTFIISNHADELTAWTPLLAFLNNAAFIAIPCCSHDLSGARFRAPPQTKGMKQNEIAPAPTTPSSAGKKMPSAYSTLCSYVMSLATETGFVAEQEVLRIPSTRNICIVGRRRRGDAISVSAESNAHTPEEVERRKGVVRDIVQREMGKSVHDAAKEWVEKAVKLGEKPGSGH